MKDMILTDRMKQQIKDYKPMWDVRLSGKTKALLIVIASRFRRPFSFRALSECCRNNRLIVMWHLNNLISTGYVKKYGNDRFYIPPEYYFR